MHLIYQTKCGSGIVLNNKHWVHFKAYSMNRNWVSWKHEIWREMLIPPQCFLFFHYQLLFLLYLHHPLPTTLIENILSPNLSLVNFGQVIFQTTRMKTEKRHVPTFHNQSRAKVGWTPRFPASYPVCRGKPCGFCSFSSDIHFLSLTISHLYIMHLDHCHTPFYCFFSC